MLLAPIARLFDITIDTLLSFSEEPTIEEINSIIHEADNILKLKTYEEAFRWATDKINQFPNSQLLIWQIAMIFDGWCMMNDIPDSEKYDNNIIDYYIRALESKDEGVRTSAANALFEFYVRREHFEKAEEYLSYFSKQIIENLDIINDFRKSTLYAHMDFKDISSEILRRDEKELTSLL